MLARRETGRRWVVNSVCADAAANDGHAEGSEGIKARAQADDSGWDAKSAATSQGYYANWQLAFPVTEDGHEI